MRRRERELRALVDRFDSVRWRGTRETRVNPNTIEALVTRGLLEYAPPELLKRERRLLARRTTEAST